MADVGDADAIGVVNCRLISTGCSREAVGDPAVSVLRTIG